MTEQILNPATMRPDAFARVEAFDHNSKEALKAYRAAIDALGRVNEERAVEPGQRTRLMAWLRERRWPRNKQYSKGQLPASDAVVDGTH